MGISQSCGEIALRKIVIFWCDYIEMSSLSAATHTAGLTVILANFSFVLFNFRFHVIVL